MQESTITITNQVHKILEKNDHEIEGHDQDDPDHVKIAEIAGDPIPNPVPVQVTNVQEVQTS